MKKNKICGIYSITNITNGKIYVGSSNNIERRWREHKNMLKSKKHHSTHLQNAWDKYGEDNFLFEILEECNENILLKREQYYIDFYSSADCYYGYNQSEIAGRPSITQEQRDRCAQILSEKFKGEGSWCNIYSETQIINLIEDLKTGEYSYGQLSKKHNISYDIVASVAGHASWKYLTDGIEFPKGNKSTRENVKLTETDVVKIVELLQEGYTNNEIAEVFSVNVHTISDIRNHKTWKNFTQNISFTRSPRNKKYIGLKEQIIKTKLETNLSNIKISKIFDVSPTFVDVAVRQINEMKEK